MSLALRLIAVYGGSAAAVLWLAHRFVRPLPRAAALFLALAPCLLVGKALVTGGLYGPLDVVYDGEPFAAHRAEARVGPTQTPLLSDVAYQGFPWRKAVRDAVKNGHWPLWNRFVLAGTPLLAAQLASVFHPGTWIGMLLPLPQAWTFDMALRFLVSLVSAFLFFRELGCRTLASLIGACGWGFSDFLVFLAGHPQSPAIGPFPLLLLGLRRLARDADRRAAALTGVALLLMVAAGHPESLLHTVAAAGIYFVVELFGANRERRGKALALSLATGALVLGLGAVSLLPFLEALPKSQELRDRAEVRAPVDAASEPALEVRLRHSLTVFVPYAYGVSGQGRVASYLARPAGGYAGSLLLALAVVGFGTRRRERWLLLLSVVLGLSLFVGLPPVAPAVSALPLFSLSLNHRLVFLAAFGICALAAFGADALQEKKGVSRFIAAALGLAAVLLAIAFWSAPRLLALGMTREFLAGRILCQVLPLLAAAVLVAAFVRRDRSALAVGSVLVLLLAARGLEARTVHPTFPEGTFYPRLAMLDAIDRGEPSRIVGAGYTFVPGAAAIYGLEDVRGYEMTTFAPLVETFPLWCVRQPVWFNRVDDLSRPFLSFLNVRHAIAPPGLPAPPGWKARTRGRRPPARELARAAPGFRPAADPPRERSRAAARAALRDRRLCRRGSRRGRAGVVGKRRGDGRRQRLHGAASRAHARRAGEGAHRDVRRRLARMAADRGRGRRTAPDVQPRVSGIRGPGRPAPGDPLLPAGVFRRGALDLSDLAAGDDRGLDTAARGPDAARGRSVRPVARGGVRAPRVSARALAGDSARRPARAPRPRLWTARTPRWPRTGGFSSAPASSCRQTRASPSWRRTPTVRCPFS